MFILGVISFAVVPLSVLFKIVYFPGANCLFIFRYKSGVG